MTKRSPAAITYQSISEWLPLALITGGLILAWADFEYSGLILAAGFLTYGIFGLAHSIKNKYYRHPSTPLVKLIAESVIIVLAASLFSGSNNLFILLMLILLDRLILTPRSEAVVKRTNDRMPKS